MDTLPDSLRTMLEIAEIAQTPLTGFLLYLNWVLWNELSIVNARMTRILFHLIKMRDKEWTDDDDIA